MSTNIQEIKISKLTGKLKGFEAINTNTLTNDFCSKMRKSDAICAQCYSAKMLQGVRKNCAEPWQKNSNLLSSRVLKSEELPTINAHSFRFHAHGELLNYVHLKNFINICNKNPFTTFALWTKRKELIAKASKEGILPTNLILIFSNPKTTAVMHQVPQNFDKVFNASPRTAIEAMGETDCTGESCINCMACYRKDNDKNIIVERIK